MAGTTTTVESETWVYRDLKWLGKQKQYLKLSKCINNLKFKNGEIEPYLLLAYRDQKLKCRFLPIHKNGHTLNHFDWHFTFRNTSGYPKPN